MPAPISSAQAFAILRDTQMFCDTHVGFAAATPPEVQAYRVLLNDQNAPEQFKLLLSQANPPGQLYALCGLYEVDPPAFTSQVNNWRSVETSINTLFGCIASPIPMNVLVAEIESGYWPKRFQRAVERSTTSSSQ
ncbi:MAG: hypothetical protein IT443_09520 [Phycisphaeraceae bacterium]|nr:hypothetical protein [Phycisphaeraceae bacterium]